MGNVKIKDIRAVMNEIAPENTAADFDNVGLLVGDENATVTGIVLALDVDEAVIDFAVQNGCNLIITHHPLIFSPIKSVTTSTPVGLLVYKLISSSVSLYSAHTNFDKAEGGVDDVLADMIGMKNPVRVDDDGEDKNSGFGRIGTLDGISVGELKKRLSEKIKGNIITTADENKIINTAFSCAGAGGSCIEKAIKHKADIFITGEIGYHASLDAKRMGLDVILLSHQLSEQEAVNILKDTLQNHLKGVKYNVRVILAPFRPFWN